MDISFCVGPKLIKALSECLGIRYTQVLFMGRHKIALQSVVPQHAKVSSGAIFLGSALYVQPSKITLQPNDYFVGAFQSRAIFYLFYFYF